MRVPSDQDGQLFGAQSPTDIVASNIGSVNTVAGSIDSGVLGRVHDNLGDVEIVANNIGDVNATAAIAPYLPQLTANLDNLEQIVEQLAPIMNCSNNMATLLLLQARMSDLTGIITRLPDIQELAAIDAEIVSVYEAIPDIVTLVGHMGSVVTLADAVPQLTELLANASAVVAVGQEIVAIKLVADNMAVIKGVNALATQVTNTHAAVAALKSQVDTAAAIAVAAKDAAVAARDVAVASRDSAQANANKAEDYADIALQLKNDVRDDTVLILSKTQAAIDSSNSASNSAALAEQYRDAAFNSAALAQSAQTQAIAAATSARADAEYIVDSVADVTANATIAANAVTVVQAATTRAETAATTATTQASKATAEAAAAKTQADRAKTEADKAAAVVTGGTATLTPSPGKIPLADAQGKIHEDWLPSDTVPFPDVWIPFSDNLRMLAGDGDDIKVGPYTVATQATFSRASAATYIDKSETLRVAAPDEPRFEKDGLLIEGQSTNLCTASEYTPAFWTPNNTANSVGTEVTFPQFGNSKFGKLTEVSTAEASRYFWLSNVGGLTEGGTYTLSVWVFIGPDSPVTRIRLGSNDFTEPTSAHVDVVKGFNRIVYTGVLAAGKTTIKPYVWPQIGTTFAWPGVVNRELMSVGCLQCEALPFASSYIPTNGAAATRAADNCSIRWPQNLPQIKTGYPITTSCAVNLLGPRPLPPGELRNVVGTIGTGANFQLRFETNVNMLRSYRAAGAAATTATPNGVINAVMRVEPDDTVTTAVNSALYKQAGAAPVASGTPTLLTLGSNALTSSYLYGHIRNLRIWRTALSDAQIKGLK